MKRQRRWSLFLCLLSGCSTHPLVDTLDFFKPGKLGPNKVAPYGGVAIPQGPIVPVAPTFPAGGVPLPPGVGIIPPAAPLPGNQPFQLQPPTPNDVPPAFPPPPPAPRSF